MITVEDTSPDRFPLGGPVTIGDGVELSGVRCSNCGAERSKIWRTAPRPTPCLYCGARTLTMTLAATASIRFGGRAAATVTYAQAEGWDQRWKDIQVELANVKARRPGGINPESVNAAVRQLRSFYVLAYHLKDALKAEDTATGVAAATVEAAANANPALALLGDLANLDKHGRLNKPPKSGHVPALTAPKGAGSLDEPGWSLKLVVEHNGRQLDGVAIAVDSVAAWRGLLQGWGLI